jgi:diguanylate cyclase (GGDEF)-like protein/putative nucleotidyltransferase with HDIG domain
MEARGQIEVASTWGAPMQKREVAFETALSLIAGGVLAYNGLQIESDQWMMLIGLAALICASGLLRLIVLSSAYLTFTAGGLMVAFLVGGPHVAAWALALGTLANALVAGGPIRAHVFNIAQVTLSGWAAFRVFELAGGVWGPGFDHLVPALVAASAYMVANALLYAVSVWMSDDVSVLATLRVLLDAAGVRAYMTTMLVGILEAFVYLHAGWMWAVAVMGFAFAVSGTSREYFRAVNEARSQASQLEVLLNATQGALVMTDPAGVIQVANHNTGLLLGVEPVELIGRRETDVRSLQRLKGRVPQPADGGFQVIVLEQNPARCVQWYRAKVCNASGELQGHIDVFTDVTPLKAAEENLRHLHDSMIRTLTAAIDARDSYTHGHSARVSEYSVAIARHMGLLPQDLERIRYSGLLHDIGKVGLDDRILRKPGALSPSERAMMMQHPVIGAEVLAKADVLADLIPGVRWHHEWLSGGGYPDGLKGDEIPLDARIIGAADAFDAMTTARPYRPALPVAEAVRRIVASMGTQFDPAVADALVAVVANGEIAVEQQTVPAAAELPDEQEAGVIRPVHGKELSILYELSRGDYSSLNLELLLHRYLETFYDLIAPNVYMVYLTNPDTGELELNALAGLPGRQSAGAKDLRFVRRALEQRAPVVEGDLHRVDGYRPASATARSELVVPLVTQEEVLGALVVESSAPDFFRRDDVYLFEVLGQRLCTSVKLIRYHERLSFAATHDGLTGVFNHHYFYERLTEEVSRSIVDGCSVAVVLLDINGLKAINDTYGHLAGDAALREYGQVLRQLAGPGVLVARYGGDEFALILPQTTRTEAEQTARELSQGLQRPFTFAGHTMPLPTAGWGVASFPEDASRATELVCEADRRLYLDKRRRKCVELRVPEAT